MKQVKKVNEALDMVKACLDSLLSRKTELETIIHEKNTGINRLMSLAVSLNDFCEYIPLYIKAYAKDESDAFSLMVSGVKNGRHGKHALVNVNSETKDRHLSLKNFEDENGNIFPAGLLIGMSGGIYNETGSAIMKKMCFFFPDIVSEKLIEVFKSSDIDWGYEDNMPVAERRVKIAGLVAERNEVQLELDEVIQEIERIDRLTDAIPRIPKEEPESIYGRRAGEHDTVIEASPDGHGQVFATIS